MKIILGSGSKWRADELRKAGIEFTQMSPDINEKMIRDTDPKKLTMALAHAKADALLPKITDPALLITSDQVVVCDGKILEKPENKDEARAFLNLYATHPPGIVNAVVITNTGTGKRIEAFDEARIFYKPSITEVIEEVLKDEEIMTCAGALQSEHELMVSHMDHLEGSMDSFTGMPIALVQKMLKEAAA